MPDMGFENAALRQVSMYDSSNLASPRFLPRQEPFQCTDGPRWRRLALTHTSLNHGRLANDESPMDTLPLIVLLLHPLLASGLVVWIWWQYAWRKKSYELKGEERATYLARHEANGERLLWATGAVILVAFAARGFTGWYEGEGLLASLVPQSLHGFMGPVGFALMVILTRFGKQARTQRQAGESFAVAKLKHGRSADLIVYLVFIHAFLGFIYTFDVLM